MLRLCKELTEVQARTLENIQQVSVVLDKKGRHIKGARADVIRRLDARGLIWFVIDSRCDGVVTGHYILTSDGAAELASLTKTGRKYE